MRIKLSKLFLISSLAATSFVLGFASAKHSEIYDYAKNFFGGTAHNSSELKSKPKDKYTVVFVCMPPFDAQLKLLLDIHSRLSFDNVANLQIDAVLRSTNGYCDLRNEEIVNEDIVEEIKNNLHFHSLVGSPEKSTEYLITTKLFKLSNGRYARFGIIKESFRTIK